MVTLLWCVALGIGGTVLKGRVVDEHHSPVPYAHVMINDRGTSCDVRGQFFLHIGRGPQTVVVSAMGYTPRQIAVDGTGDTVSVEIVLVSTTIALPESVVIYGDRATHDSHKRNSVDDHFREVVGVQTLRRANFASEPVIRAYGADRVAVVIDGMSLQSACVDKMDPVSAYVETENLNRMEIDKAGTDLTYGRQIGGTVNLVPAAPLLDHPFSIRSGVSYEHASSLRRLLVMSQAGADRWAYRISASAKRAGDYRAGGGKRMENSGYDKINTHIGVLHRPSDRHTWDMSTIVDGAWNVGYPSMIMDARRTRAAIVSLAYSTHSILHADQVKIRVYGNRIDHWMDDADRDVATRDVMTGMHMPMVGRSQTVGVRSEWSWVHAMRLWKITTDLQRVTAFADMRMQPLDASVREMYLVNLASINDTRGSLIIEGRYRPAMRWEWRSSLRVDGLLREPQNDEGIRSLRIFYPLTSLRQTRVSASMSAQAIAHLSATHTMSLAISRLTRPPTMIESHGYFLYNAQDGRMYVGKPNLRDEERTQLELHWTRNGERVQWEAAVYGSTVANYILGTPIDSAFHTYKNLHRAWIAGGEASCTVRWSSAWMSRAVLSSAYGHNRDDRDPLPLVSPVQGNVLLQWSASAHRTEWTLHWSRPQRRVSRIAREDATAGYVIVDWSFMVKLGKEIELRGGMENILDRRYHDHLSYRNLPARGRNVYVGLEAQIR